MSDKQFVTTQNNWDPRGSIWRKWDLHVHTPGTKLDNGYKTGDEKNTLDEFCNKLEESDVDVFGLTDYFSVKNYFTVVRRFTELHPKSKKMFFPNIELRLNETVNKKSEEVNLHLIFNTSSVDKIEEFLGKLNVVKTGADGISIACSELSAKTDFESATVTRDAIDKAFTETFGKKARRRDHFLVFAAANNDGIRAASGQQRKAIISDEIDKFSDAFFGGQQNVDYFQMRDRLEDITLSIQPKPVFTGSDAHSFEQLAARLGKQMNIIVKRQKIRLCDVTWVKAERTFEGLKQALYEPSTGERVSIGVLEPDTKEGFKVIKKISFEGDKDFPTEVEFNRNLCSIIGSRSSGKSALLAYIAYAIDPSATQELIEGPGEGEPYDKWSNLSPPHLVEWGDSDTETTGQGRVVYIPQNHLFEQSKNPDVIKSRIEPVLFSSLPGFGALSSQTTSKIKIINRGIGDSVRKWFEYSDEVEKNNQALRTLGDRGAVVGEKKEIEENVEKLKKETELSEEEVGVYKIISTQLSTSENRIKEIKTEISLIGDISTQQGLFTDVSMELTPGYSSMRPSLREAIGDVVKRSKKSTLSTLNKIVVDYVATITNEMKTSIAFVDRVKRENKELLKKYENNIVLNNLLKQLNKQTTTIEAIDTLIKKQGTISEQLSGCVDSITKSIKERATLISTLEKTLNDGGENTLNEITFRVEVGYGDALISAASSMNLIHTSIYFLKVDDSEPTLNIARVRGNPKVFLEDLYLGNQKIKADVEPEQVAREAFELTEKILFSGEMEGDKIGGFASSTMTPGKRALFTLRLILAESADTWPLLIDQPEDDLDSRSLYNDIVPLLKQEKKKRQIIMVSHNANLVIASDSEQVVVANRNGGDRPNEDGKQFNYLSGALENTKENDGTVKDTLLSQGVREHSCEILDGGKLAFEQRRNKYSLQEQD